MGESGGVAKFDGAWPNDSAQREQMQGFLLLSACLPIVSPSCQWHGSILLWCVSCVDVQSATSKALFRNLYRCLWGDGNGCIEQRVLRLPGEATSEGRFDRCVPRRTCRLFLGSLGEWLRSCRLAFACAPSLSRAFLMSYPLCAGGVRIGEAVRTGNTVEVGVDQPKEGGRLDSCRMYLAPCII